MEMTSRRSTRSHTTVDEDGYSQSDGYGNNSASLIIRMETSPSLLPPSLLLLTVPSKSKRRKKPSLVKNEHAFLLAIKKTTDDDDDEKQYYGDFIQTQVTNLFLLSTPLSTNSSSPTLISLSPPPPPLPEAALPTAGTEHGYSRQNFIYKYIIEG
ncbi:hypothetical protein L6452_13090 [Arctium lappa]|uniref:Uncharacterized protein n=1 Tax=Arctium lappa TaxID=4217 RepID=A0ACB9CH90_ARCLA|nr:hypothetical protein L6452_13090 [Arctium lappa]